MSIGQKKRRLATTVEFELITTKKLPNGDTYFCKKDVAGLILEKRAGDGYSVTDALLVPTFFLDPDFGFTWKKKIEDYETALRPILGDKLSMKR
jgi:hypothetical protein